MPDNYSIPNLEPASKSDAASKSDPSHAILPKTSENDTSIQTPAPPTDTESPVTGTFSIFNGNKGLLIAIVIAVIAAIIGISAFIGFNSSSQYQGLIKKVENETQKLKGK